MKIELFLALQLLRDARAQSLLIATGTAVGVAVLVFLSALIAGLQEDLIERTVGSQAHVVLSAPEAEVRPLFKTTAAISHVVLTTTLQPERPNRAIAQGATVLRRVRSFPGVSAAAALCRGPATATRGQAEVTALVSGLDPSAYSRVVDLRSRVSAGELRLGAQRAAIGAGLADRLGVTVGDRLRLQTASAAPRMYEVAAILDFGVQRIDDGWVLLALSDAQRLLQLPGGVTHIEAATHDLFAATDVARRLQGQTGLEVVSWMDANAQLLTGLRSQDSSSKLIQAFVLLSVAIGIASVLVVSVVQRRREVGILRAMGIRRRTVQRIFLIQGGLLGLLGAIMGSALGAALLLLFGTFALREDGTPLFPLNLTPALFAGASVIALLTGIAAAVFPARRAAALDPAVAIRND